MQVDELLKPFPIKEFHPFPRAMLGPGAWSIDARLFGRKRFDMGDRNRARKHPTK